MPEVLPTQITVAPEDAGKRLDRFLALRLDVSRARIQQLISEQKVLVNEKPARASLKLRGGERITVVAQGARPPLRAIAEDIPLHILYEDADLAIVYKPSGMMVHGGAGATEDQRNRGTLVNALLHHFAKLSALGGEMRPGIVHRLDKETSGCLVIAKNDQAHQGLAIQFAARSVEKIYLAIVAGKLRKTAGVIEEKIGRHPVDRQRMSVTSSRGRAAKTEYRVIRSSDKMSLVECQLHTGRTHQIRVHLHHLGHPVLGDKVYAPKLAKEYPRQMLHAWKLGFQHPRTDEWKSFVAPLPNDFTDALRSIGLSRLNLGGEAAFNKTRRSERPPVVV